MKEKGYTTHGCLGNPSPEKQKSPSGNEKGTMKDGSVVTGSSLNQMFWGSFNDLFREIDKC